MEMLSSFRGDKHEFCLVVIKFMQFTLINSLTLYLEIDVGLLHTSTVQIIKIIIIFY